MANNSKRAALQVEVAQLFSTLKQVVADAEPDSDKFTIKDNEAAGTRLRKAMQEGKGLMQQIREKVQEAKNAKDA